HEASINDGACRAGARIEGPDLEAYYVVSCGSASFGKGAMYDSSEFDAILGVQSRQQQLEDAFVLDIWDKDVPCDVSVTWSKQSPEVNRTQAYAMAKDLLAQLTPESIKRPRVDLVVTAEDKTGDKARAALARFADRANTVQHYAPLSPGFPKVIKSDDYPELEPGNYYLLFGICPGGSGQQMADVLDAALPSS